MKGVMKAFFQYVRAVKNDIILFFCPLAPLLVACIFKFLVPQGELLLCQYFGKVAIISPYYPMLDMLVALMTPIMFAFTGAMVMMDESDLGISRYLVVTPLGKAGYLMARIGIQTIIAMVYNVIILIFLSVSDISFLKICVISFLGAFSGIITPLIIVSFAGNKVEAMAMAKLSGITMIGIPIAMLVKDRIQYFAAIIPSYWITKYMESSHVSYILCTLLTSVFWIACLYKKFERKIIT